MSKINKSLINYDNQIKSGKATFDEKGFYLRESQLLRNEDSLLIGTENRDNILLNIKTRDTIDVRSEIENERNIDNG